MDDDDVEADDGVYGVGDDAELSLTMMMLMSH